MREPEDVPVHHLVVDSGGFIKAAPLIDLGSRIYTIQSVVDELKDRRTRNRVLAYPFDIIYREPSNESIRAVIEMSKKTGDYASLSVTDMKVIALTRDLHIEHCGQEINSEEEELSKGMQKMAVAADVEVIPKEGNDEEAEKFSKEVQKDITNADESNLSEVIPKEVDDEAEELSKDVQKETTDVDEFNLSEDDEKESDNEEKEPSKGVQRMGFGTWVDESNFSEVVNRMQSNVDPSTLKMKVACLTTDFALQNTLLHMKLNICSIDGYRVTRLRTFILRCRICKKTTSLVEKKFCPNCGHESLHKVGVSVDRDGNQKIHINWERERVTRGYRYSLPTPKGGKHGNDIRVTEDHLMPQNRMAKVMQDPWF